MNIMFATKVIALGVMIGVVACGEGVAAEAPRLQRPQDLLGTGYRFTEKDFQKEVASDKLFYVRDGDDDGMKEVSPNLQRMPAILKDAQALVTGYRPSETGDKRGKVFAYYPESTYKHTIDYVGDGWVVARAYSLMDQKYFRGFIYTDENDMYVDGQKLQHAYYVLVGVQKVPLANGSSQSMYAFVKLDSETCRLAFEAYEYNDKALYATKKENDRREVARREHAYKQERERIDGLYHKELTRVFNGFAFRDIRSQFHFPNELSSVINDLEFIDPGSFHCSKDDRELRTGIETNFENAIKSQDWRYVIDCVQIEVAANDDPVQCASNALRRAYEFTRYFKLRNNFKMSNKEYREYQEKLKKYRYYVVDQHSNTIQPETLKIGYRVQLPIDADLYCVRRSDCERVRKFLNEGDVKGFVKALDEHESNKFNDAFERVFSNFAFRNVEAQFHFPEDAQSISIEVWKGGVVMCGEDFSDDTPIIDEMLSNHDWCRLATSLGVSVSADSNSEQIAKDTFAKIPLCWRMISLKSRKYEPPRYNRATGKRSRARKEFSFFIVDKKAAEQVKFIVVEDHVWNDFRDFLQFAVGAELYCLPNEDKAIFDNVHDAKAFEELWNKKYGKATGEK